MIKKIGSLVLVAVLSASTTFVLLQHAPENMTSPNPAPSYTPAGYHYNLSSVSAAPTDFVDAATKSIDAVVHVKNTNLGATPRSPWEYFYGRGSAPSVGMGSGVIVSPDGFILTNNHVIEDASKIEVTTNDNRRFEAELIGTDPYTDIAVLKISPQNNLPFLSFGNSDAAKIGEWVLAIGNPFNLNSTVTAGIISAKARDLNERDDKNQSFIQTDAAVNRGNSGGALINTQGELIGINTAITSLSGGFEGYSFAVPSNIALKVFEDLVEYGSIRKGLLGVRGSAIVPEIKAALEERNVFENEGFYVNEVMEGMGAQAAGIQADDVILQVDDVKIRKFSDLTGYLESKRPEDVVRVKISRAGKIKTLEVSLTKTTTAQFLRMELSNMTPKEQEAFGLKEGVVIRNANRLGNMIEEGSLLLEVNGERIRSVEDLASISQWEVDWITYITPDGEKYQLQL